MSEWQPIATAPKDESFVLLWWPHWSSRAVVGQCRFGAWSAEHFPTSWDDEPPTHWMPLPEPHDAA